MSGTYRWVVPALLASLALVPVAQAETVTSDLVFAGPLDLQGHVSWSGQSAFVDLTDGERIAQTTAPPALTATAARVDVYERVARTDTYALPLGTVQNEASVDEAESTVYDVGGARLQLGPAARIMLLDGHLEGTFDSAQLRMAREAGAYVDPHLGDAGRQSHQSYVFGHTAQDAAVLEAPGGTLTFTGTFTLAFWDATLVLVGPDGEHGFAAGSFETEGDAPLATSQEERLVAATFHEGRLQLAAPGHVRIAGAAPTIALDGNLASEGSEGTLKLARDVISLDGGSLSIDGVLSLQPRIVRTAEADAQPANVLVEPYRSGRVVTQGDAASVYVAGRLVESIPLYPADAVAAGAAGLTLLALTASLWRFGPLLGAALYSRLETGSLLENTTRAQIYDIVCANPGINARGVHRLADASWGTVVHHLNKLRDAGYLAVHARGRAKCFYENHGKWDEDQSAIALLQSETTGQVAAAVCAVEGRDQTKIVERTGLPQSTVSYHLLKLEKAGLVSKERLQNALVYYPTVRLRTVMQRLREAEAMPSSLVLPHPDHAVGGAA